MIGAALLIGVHAAMAIGDGWSRWSVVEQHRAYGEAMLAHGEPEQARAAFERAYALGPSAESWAALVESQAALVARAQRVPPQQRAALIAGLDTVDAGEGLRAMRYAIARGYLADGAGDAEAAEAAFREAVAAAPDGAAGHLALGRWLVTARQDEAAIASLESAVERSTPGHWTARPARLALGRALLARGEAEPAAKPLTEARALRDDFEAAHLAGRAEFGRARWTAAAQAFQTALAQLPPGQPLPDDRILDALGMALFRAGEPEAAVPVLRRAVAERGRVDSLHNLAVVQSARGEHGEAAALFERVVQRRPQDAEAHWRLIEARRAAGDLVGARNAALSARALADAHPELARLRPRIDQLLPALDPSAPGVAPAPAPVKGSKGRAGTPSAKPGPFVPAEPVEGAAAPAPAFVPAEPEPATPPAPPPLVPADP